MRLRTLSMPGMMGRLGEPLESRILVNPDSGVVYLEYKACRLRMSDDGFGPAIPKEVIQYSRSIRHYYASKKELK